MVTNMINIVNKKCDGSLFGLSTTSSSLIGNPGNKKQRSNVGFPFIFSSDKGQIAKYSQLVRNSAKEVAVFLSLKEH